MSGATTRERRPAARQAADGAVARRRRDARVIDADDRRARATEGLLGALAPALGLDLGALRVRADEEAAARTRGRGARGLAAGGAIWLDPGRYDPGRADGRALLAHEAAHVAQRAETRTRPDRRAPSLAEAEREAAAVAAAVREGRVPPLPLATLPAGAHAADTGVALAEPPREHELRDPLATYQGWSDELDALVPAVRQIHARRIAQIEDELDGLWISDGDVDDVLTLLEPVPYEQAAAIVRALPETTRTDLARNISPSHRSGFRAAVLAVTAGLRPSELSTQRDPLDGMSLVGLSPEERFLAVVVLLGIAHAERERLLADDARRADVTALISGRAPDAAALAAERKQRADTIDEQRAVEEQLAGDPTIQDRLARLQALLSEPGPAQAAEALDALAAMLPEATPAPTTKTAPTEPPSEPPPPPTAPADFRYAIERLEQTGAIDRMVQALPEHQWAPAGTRRKAFANVLAQRPPDANVKLALDLLGTGLFNPVSEAEARLAYEVVRALPLDARDRFLRRDEGAWLQRLEENLPAYVLKRESFGDLAVGYDEHGKLVDEGLRRSRTLTGGGEQTLKQILDTLDRGGGAGTASRVLGELTAIEDTELRAAVIRRLDTMGRLEPVIDDLPDHILLSETSRPALTAVLGDRDTYHLMRHIRRLLARGLGDWAVTSREAFLAFLMLRALPPADRELFGRLDFIVGELSAEMRASAGLHVLAAGSAEEQRVSVRERLDDDRVWRADRAPELRALIQIAVALGERRWAFEQSRRHRAWEDEALNPIVQRFELYNPIVGRTEFVPELEDKGGILEDFLPFTVIRAIGRAAWFVVSQGFRGTFYVNAWAQEAGIERLSLLDLQRAAGGELGGATVSERETENRYMTNELTVRWDDEAGTLDVDLPALELDSVGMISTAGSLRTGAVSARGIRLHADFATDDLAYPRDADVAVTDLTIGDLLAGGTTGLTAVTRVHLRGFGAHGDLSSLEPKASRVKLLAEVPVPLFGPILQVVLMLIKAARISPSGALLQGIRAELESFEVEGIALPGDQQVASLEVAGITLGWGATRAQYLRLLIEQLARRAQAAGAAEERDRLNQELAEARKELAVLETTEQELIDLLRRARNEPASMTEDDHRRLLELQQQRPGGVVVETGPITIRGVGGAIAAREIQVERVSGHGEAAAATLEVLTDEAFLRRFTQQGPPAEDPTAWSGEFELGKLKAVDVVYGDAIPSTEDLTRERDQLRTDAAKLTAQPQILTRVKNRIDLLEMALELRGEFDELAVLEDPSPAQIERRRELRATLARHFAIAVDLIEAERAVLTGRAETGSVELSAQTLEVSKLTGDAYAIESISGTGVSADYSLATGATAFGADELQIKDVRADELGSTVADVDMRGVTFTAKAIENGWRIEGLEIATMTLGLIDWGNASKRVMSSRPVTVTGLTATVEATWTGEGAAAESLYAIKRLDIERIEVSPGTGPGLVYEDLASGLRAELFAGAVEGVWAQDFAIRMGTETTFEAASDEPSIGFKRFDALRFAAAFGESFKVGGVLSSPGGVTEDALGITFVASGAYAFDLQSLTLTDGVLSTPDGSVRIVRLPLSGRVTYASEGAESRIGLEGLTIPDVVLGDIDWKFKGGLIRARGRTSLRGITATAGIVRDAEGVAAATVTDVRIDAIDAQDLRYTKGPIDVHVNRAPAAGRPPLEVRDVRIQGLEYTRAGGVAAGEITVGPAAVGLEAQLSSALASGTLRAEAISVRFFPGSRLSVSAEDIDVQGQAAKGADKVALSTSDVDAHVDVEPNRIRIRATGAKPSPANLVLPPIRVPELDFTLKGVHVQLLSGGTIDVDSLDTDVVLDLGSGDKEPAIKRVTLANVALGALKAGRLLIEDPTLFRVELTDPTSPAVVRGLTIKDLALDQNLAGAWSLAGYATMHADEITVDWVQLLVRIGVILKRFATPGAATSFNPAALAPFAQAMNSLDGHVAFKVACPIFVESLGRRYRLDDPNDLNAPVRVVIRRGEVNIAQVLQAFGWGTPEALGFVLRGPTLVVVFDPGAAARHLPWVGRSIRGAVQVDIAWWNLTTAELTRLQAPDVDFDAGRVPLDLFGLTQVQLPTGGPAAPAPPPPPPAPGPAPAPGVIEFHTGDLEIRDIDARLSMVNDKPVPIVLGVGTIILAPFALDDMRISGEILPGSAPLQLGVDRLGVQALDVALPYGLGQLTSAELSLSGLVDGRLSFDAPDAPKDFEGRIAHLRWRDVRMTGTPAP